MGETNGFDQNGRGTLNPPEVDIPLLKKQEKERKGAGVVLPGGVPGGGALAAGVNAGQATGFMALFAGKAGLAALALGVVGAGAIGVGLMGGGSGSPKPTAPQLDGLSSSINVDQRNAHGSKSLSYMAKAGSGQLKWDDPNAPKPAAASDKKSDAPADTAGAGGEAVDESASGAEGDGGEGGGSAKPRMSGGLSGAKLSSSLGGSGAFGKNNIFSKGSGFNMKSVDLKAKSGLEGGASRLTSAGKGSLSGKMRGKNSLMASGKNTARIKGNGALGQLKFAGTRSQAASKAGDSGAASTFAADAFDQQKTTGGNLETGAGGIGDGAAGTVNPAGGGAPDVTGGETGCPEGWGAAEGGGCTAPDITNGVDQTKYQGLVDGVLQMQKMAMMLKLLGAALIIGGALSLPWPWGWAIIAAGVALVAMAVMMDKQADQMADQIGSMYQQKKQADVLKARGEGDASTPELEERRLEEQKKQNEGPGFTEEEPTPSEKEQ